MTRQVALTLPICVFPFVVAPSQLLDVTFRIRTPPLLETRAFSGPSLPNDLTAAESYCQIPNLTIFQFMAFGRGGKLALHNSALSTIPGALPNLQDVRFRILNDAEIGDNATENRRQRLGVYFPSHYRLFTEAMVSAGLPGISKTFRS